jgi:hypothetical protein
MIVLQQDDPVPDIVPASPDAVVAAITSLVDGREGRVRLAIDGAPAAEPEAWGSLVVAGLSPRPALHLRADLFWQPAGLRYESGREDVDAWLDRWLDTGALRREALDGFPRTGRVLPGLRDPRTDRSLRAAPLTLADQAVLVVSGRTLLGRGLPFDASVHLWLSAGALARRTPASDRWTLPALERYEREIDLAAEADLVVRVDDPHHPALVRRGGGGGQH